MSIQTKHIRGNRFDTMDTVVRNICSLNGDKRARNYIPVATAVARTLEQLNMHIIPNIQSELLTINDNLTVDMPDDTLDVIKAGVVGSNNRVRILGRDDELVRVDLMKAAKECTCQDATESTNIVDCCDYIFTPGSDGTQRIMGLYNASNELLDLDGYPYEITAGIGSNSFTSDLSDYFASKNIPVGNIYFEWVAGPDYGRLIIEQLCTTLGDISLVKILATSQVLVTPTTANCQKKPLPATAVSTSSTETATACSLCTFHNTTYHGQFIGEIYGYQAPQFSNGRFRYDQGNNRIELSTGYDVKAGNQILVEYRPVVMADTYRLIPRKAFMVIRQRVHQMLAEGHNLSKAGYHFDQFRREYAMLKRTYNNYTLADYLAAFRGSYSSSVKG